MGVAVTTINSPNYTRYFYPADDKWEMKKFPVKVSVAYSQ